MILILALRSQTRILIASAHHPREKTDATPSVTIVDTARAPAIEKIQIKNGAGLEVLVIMTETEGAGMVAGAGTAENMAITGEVGYTLPQFLLTE